MPEGALFTKGQSEKDGGNKTRMLLQMSLGVISTKQIRVFLRKYFLKRIGSGEFRSRDFLKIKQT